VYSRFFDTHAADRSTNGVDGLLAAPEDKRIKVSLHAAAKAQAAQTFKQPTPGKGDGGNPKRPTASPDMNLKDKELKDKEERDKREKDKKRQHKKPEPEAKGLWCAPPRRFMLPIFIFFAPESSSFEVFV
jgi:hypothetical protein